MPDLADGESTEMKGSAAKPYELKNTGGVYSCSCPAWRNHSTGIERRSCKHLRKLRGAEAEDLRCGGAAAVRTPRENSGSTTDGCEAEGAEDKAPPLLLAHSWENE